MNVTVLGAGAWGTALALVLHHNRHGVTLWGHDPERLRRIAETGRNDPALPGIDIPRDWRLEPDLHASVAGADLVLIAVPSRAFRGVASRVTHLRCPVVTATKGIEDATGLTMGGVLAELLPHGAPTALSGPSFAIEVARGAPTAVVAASTDAATAEFVQTVFHRPEFRVYRSTDRLGVEFGGALKNVIAIAAGVCDGLGLGDNSKAALVTRGQAEVRRLGVACGARPETFAGLSGLGDLTLTCFSRHSRNRALGERLGRGETIEAVASGGATAEGVPTALSAFHLARRMGVDIPIIEQVHAMLYERKDIHQGVRDLLQRDLKEED